MVAGGSVEAAEAVGEAGSAETGVGVGVLVVGEALGENRAEKAEEDYHFHSHHYSF